MYQNVVYSLCLLCLGVDASCLYYCLKRRTLGLFMTRYKITIQGHLNQVRLTKYVQALCLSVDACFSYGLKRRALGLFKIRYEKSI